MQSIERLLVLVEHYITTVEVGLLKTLILKSCSYISVFWWDLILFLMRSHVFESITRYVQYGLSTFGCSVIYLNDWVHGVTEKISVHV